MASLKNSKDKKVKAPRPQPGMLGTGAAKSAAQKLKDRRKLLQSL